MINWKKNKLFAFTIFFIFQTSIASPLKKPWTFIVYMAAANSLNSFAHLDIGEMAKVGSNEYVNVLVYLTLQIDGQAKTTQRYYIEKGKAVEIQHDVPMDSGSPDTLFQALTWAVNDYPSEHLAVVLWDHGSGPLNRCPSWMRGICYDDDTGNFLTDLNYKSVFEEINKIYRGGKKIDLVACDACLMADVEVAFALQDCADFFVASQETIPGDGYDYSRVLSKFKTGTLEPEVFARAMIEAYNLTYEGQKDYTLSLIDLKEISHLTEDMANVSTLLTSYLKKDKSGKMKRIIEKCTSKRYCLHFTEKTYIDLYGFYRALLRHLGSMTINHDEQIELGRALVKVQRTCNNCILDNVHSEDLKSAHGLSIYFPSMHEGIQASYPATHWALNTNWLNFLEAYCNLGGKKTERFDL
jgi:Clostripain family